MDLWHEDPEFIMTMLDLLSDELLSEDQSSVSSTTDAERVTSSTALYQTKSGPRVVNKSRERRRDEVRSLRATTAELETQLATLKLRREERLRNLMRANDGAEIRDVAVVWEELATRQFRHRRHAETVNTRLRSMLATQQRMTTELIASIRRAEETTRQHNAEVAILLANTQLRLPPLTSRKASDDEKLRRLDVLLSQSEAAFARSRKFNDGSSVRFLDIQRRYGDCGGGGDAVVVDVFVSWALPFARPVVEESLWTYFLGNHTDSHDHSWLQEIQLRNDVHSGVFHAVSIVDGRHRVSFDGDLVAKHFRNDRNHLMAAIITNTKPHCVSMLLQDIVVEEDAWVRIADANDLGGVSLAGPLTVVQSVRQFHIRFNNSGNHYQTPSELHTRRALSDFAVQLIKNDILKGKQVVEDWLLTKTPSRQPEALRT